MKPTSCPPRAVVVQCVCDEEQTAGSMEDDCSAADSSTAASDGDSIAITSNTVLLRAGDGKHLFQESLDGAKSFAVSNLCVDEIVHAFSYLSPVELLAVGSTCRAFRKALQLADCYLWSAHCKQLWKGKQRFSGAVDEFEKKRSELAATDSLSILQACRTPRTCLPFTIGAFVSPFERSCMSVLQGFGMDEAPKDALKLDKLLSSRDSVGDLWWNLPPEEKIWAVQQLVEPAHEARPSSWRFAFFMSSRDAKRQSLTKHDLTTGTWRISFKQSPDAAKHWNLPVRFTSSGTLETGLHGPLAVQLCQQGTVLQVSSLPPLAVRRGGDDEEWKWVIENFFVRIESVDIPMPTYLKHLQQHTSMRPP